MEIFFHGSHGISHPDPGCHPRGQLHTDPVLIANLTEKIKFKPSKKNSRTIPGSWMVPRSRGMNPDDPGTGGSRRGWFGWT